MNNLILARRGDNAGIICLCIIGGLVVIAFWAWLAKKFTEVAEDKGYITDREPFYKTKYFWLVFLLGMIGMVYIAALPDLKTRYMIELNAKVSKSDINSTKNTNSNSSNIMHDKLPDL